MWLLYFITMPIYIGYLMIKLFVGLIEFIFTAIGWLIGHDWSD